LKSKVVRESALAVVEGGEALENEILRTRDENCGVK
jgi:hypothetical protein